MAKTKKAASEASATKAKKPATRNAARPKAAKTKAAGIEKKYLKTRPVCKVTFTLPSEAASEAESVCILGEFNNWSADANPLRKLEDGSFTVTLDLDTGHSYHFRYIIDGWKYENDWFADRYEANPYGGEDSVVDV